MPTSAAGVWGLGVLLLTGTACMRASSDVAPDASTHAARSPAEAPERSALPVDPSAIRESVEGTRGSLPHAPMRAPETVVEPPSSPRAPETRGEAGTPPPSARWPAPGATLTLVPASVPKGFARRRVYLDAGHGAEGNTGNRSVTCEDEEVFTLRVARDLARRLVATGHFEVRISREPGQRVPYANRLADAERWGAHVFVSLHSDSRGTSQPWAPAEGQACNRQDTTPGFSVLWSEDAPAPLQGRRAELARALARNLSRGGFLHYDGVDYVGLYATDTAQPGVFVSREPSHRQIFVLRKPTMPSVIVETHHALDFEEAARWREERTLEVFATAMTQGLVESFAPAPPTHVSTQQP
ncbi:N-acetylmuramoyl-L-alanine amidase [Myxococcus sp. K38C18041901]|uniref:N-acetylmuramoyl-L-alanine amidase family protein n=1 Tax=Myxococcus guangdongensis TaxID=2906760 RepID=UPI0020A7CB9D|nr:N-acetylmuramoyl-L-alanine amidase [Myxococcus guangdongensis]MCP3061464.1 N-acetylmuramoyl-L-alanine amidase [Myxococcus guangdongensis]